MGGRHGPAERKVRKVEARCGVRLKGLRSSSAGQVKHVTTDKNITHHADKLHGLQHVYQRIKTKSWRKASHH